MPFFLSRKSLKQWLSKLEDLRYNSLCKNKVYDINKRGIKGGGIVFLIIV